MRQYLGMIHKVKEGEFPISSFLPYDGNEEDFYNAIFSCSAGDSFSEDGQCIECHKIQKISEEDAYIDYYKDDFPKSRDDFKKQVILEFDDDKRYEFGGSALSESMAYLFEEYFFDSHDYSHVFPYNVCELLYQYIIGENCKKNTVLIALCYASMMSLFPGNTFIELLYELKEKKDKIQSMEDVFKLSDSKMLPVNKNIINELCMYIDRIFPVETENPIKIFEEESKYIRDWIKERYRYIAGHETEFREALIWIMEVCKKEKRISALAKLLDEYGHPLFVDKNGKLYSMNDEKMVHILAPFSLWGLLMERKGKCSLYQICKGNDQNTDVKCDSECWKHMCKDKKCLFKYYLYKMGLGDVQFENLKNSPFKKK